MTQYNPNIHHRRSIRLKGYNYAKEGLYFITICCQDKWPVFGKIIEGEMHLNEFGTIAQNEWLNTENIRMNCLLHEFIIMPNHMHGIIEITFNNQATDKSSTGKFQSPSQTIGSIIRGYKIATIKKIKNIILSNSDTGELQFAPSEFASTRFENSTGELRFAPSEFAQKKIIALNYKIWQRNYHDHIIRDEQAYINISNYIRNNPKNRKKK
jgi:REP element-mobilizing transposase RayT